MNNTKQIIDNHNKRIINSSKHINDTADNANAKDTKTCNCRQNNTCPLKGNCLQSSLIYQATVTRKDYSTTETCVGLTENDFKTRHRNHTAWFRHTKHRNSTDSWRIFSSRSPYMQALLQRKLLIIRRPELSSINNVINSCPHAATETKCYCVTIELSI